MTSKNLMCSVRDRLFFYLNKNRKKIEGKNNKLFLNKAVLKNNRIKINGNNNKIIISEYSSLKGCKITIKGDNHNLEIANHVSLYDCELKFEDNNCLISIGAYSRILHNGLLLVAEPFSKIEIGKHCLFAMKTHIRTTDSHSILDLTTGERINYAKSIKIGNSIWLGAYVQVLKGVTICDNSIVGVRSLVTQNIPENCLVAGVPAKIIRENVFWREERINKCELMES